MRRTIAVIVILVLLVSLTLGVIHVSYFYKTGRIKEDYLIKLYLLEISGGILTDIEDNIIDRSVILTLSESTRYGSRDGTKALTVTEAKEILSAIPQMQNKFKKQKERGFAYEGKTTIIYKDITGKNFMYFSGDNLDIAIEGIYISLDATQTQEFMEYIEKALEWIEKRTQELQENR